jgi:RpiB/LacA/LacB family sugar-phosphate isomerase
MAPWSFATKEGMVSMKTAKDKHVVVSADFAGFPLKEAVRKHLIERGWTVEDLTPILEETPMYHRAGFMLGAKIAEREFEKGLAFCGTGMGIHVAAGKVPHVHAAVCESVPAALRCATGNNCNVLAMGAFFIGPRLGMAMADAFLDHSFGEGYEDWPGFLGYHVVGYEETEHFDYEAYKANGFRLADETVPPLGPPPLGLAF